MAISPIRATIARIARPRCHLCDNTAFLLCMEFAESSYVVCCYGFDLVLQSDGTPRIVNWDRSGGEASGITVDSRACVLQLEENVMPRTLNGKHDCWWSTQAEWRSQGSCFESVTASWRYVKVIDGRITGAQPRGPLRHSHGTNIKKFQAPKLKLKCQC